MTSATASGGESSKISPDPAYPWLSNYPRNVSWKQAFSAQPVYAFLDTAVSRYPDRPCTNFMGKVLTYAQIGRSVDSIAAGLQKQGIGKGSKVGLLLPNTPTFVIYYFAILKVGATVVNYNPLYTLEELAHQVRDSETDLMVTLDLKLLFDKVEGLLKSGDLKKAVVCPFASLLPGAKSILFRLFKSGDVANVARSLAADRIILEAQLASDATGFAPVDIYPETDIAVLQYTGGTTGTPKGALLTHANLAINVQQLMAWAPNLKKAEERVLGVLPFFHVFAMTVVMNFGVAMACEIILMPRFVLDDAMKLIHGSRPTVMPGVPTLFNAIMNHPNLGNYDLSSLKFCLSGGAPLPVEIKQRFEELSGCSLVEGYGLSETSPVVTANPLEGPTRAGSIGLPLPATIVSLRDLANPTQEVPLGERGELCVSGPQVMKGYWNKADETANQFIGEFLRTGDVAVMDEEGFLFIVDRIKDLIICSGYNVYPRRIEEAIYEHPAVAEVTVIGIKDKHRGEAPKAFIKLKDGMSATAKDILKHLEPKLSRIEMPSQIEFRDSLPKTMIGKLSKKELKEEEGSRQAGA